MFGWFKKKKKAAPKFFESDIYNRIDKIPARQQVVAMQGSAAKKNSDDGDVALSMAIAMATHNPVLGAMVGGSIAGGMIGAAMDMDTSLPPVTSNDYASPGCDTSSSYSSSDSGSSSCDTGSSFDSGSGGSFDSGGSY